MEYAGASTYFCRPSRFQLFPTGCKIRYDFFNYTGQRKFTASRIYKSRGVTVIWQNMHAACLQYTKAIRECSYTDKRFDALKLMGDTEIHLLWVATWCMIENALLRACQLSVVHIVVKERVLRRLSQR